MPFIGIIVENKDFKFIKSNVLNKIKKDTNKFEIININNNNIDNIKNVRFETVVICSTLEKLNEKQEEVKNILSNAKYLIINSDIEIDKNLLQGLKFDIITYGLNQKATITASSINEDNVIICLQRNIKNIINNIIEINEFNIRLDKNANKLIYNILSYFAILLIYNKI